MELLLGTGDGGEVAMVVICKEIAWCERRPRTLSGPILGRANLEKGQCLYKSVWCYPTLVDCCVVFVLQIPFCH
jgi:hypothetical protein